MVFATGAPSCPGDGRVTPDSVTAQSGRNHISPKGHFRKAIKQKCDFGPILHFSERPFLESRFGMFSHLVAVGDAKLSNYDVNVTYLVFQRKGISVFEVKMQF